MTYLEALVESSAKRKELYRVNTLAQVLDTAPQTIRSWIRSGKLPAIKIGRSLYIQRKDVDALVEQATPVRRAQ